MNSSYEKTVTSQLDHTKEQLQRLRRDRQLEIKMIFDRYYRILVLYAGKFLCNIDESEDMVQSVFLDLYERNKMEEIKNIESYLFVSVRNKCLNSLRKESVHKFEVLEEHTVKLSEEVQDDDELQIKMKQINMEIDALPKRMKQVFVEVYFHEKSYSETADTLDISINTVKKSLVRSVKRIRRNIGNQHFVELF